MFTSRVAMQASRTGIDVLVRHKVATAAITKPSRRAAAVIASSSTHAPTCRCHTLSNNNKGTRPQPVSSFRYPSKTSPSHHHHHYSTPPTMADLSSTRMIYSALQSYGHTKWGFVFYRTSYTSASEILWPRFQSILVQRAHSMISESDTPELLNSLDYKFVSDVARLDDVGIAAVQRIHAEWRVSPAAQGEQPEGSASVWPSEIPRYKHCIQVDEETMRNVVEGPQPPEVDFDGETFVKFVHCDWPSSGDQKESWMLLASWMLVTDAYDIFHDENVNWYTFWKSPPTVVNH